MKLNIILLSALLMAGCTNTIKDFSDYEKTKSEAVTEVIDLIEKKRTTMNQGNLEDMLSIYPDTFFAVEQGQVFKVPKTLAKHNFENRFKTIRYEIQNLSDPVVGLSEDLSMAWAVTHVNRKVIDLNTDEVIHTDQTSGLIVLHKINGLWKLMAASDTTQ